MRFSVRAAVPLLPCAAALLGACRSASRQPSPEATQHAQALAAADSALAHPISAHVSQQAASLTGIWALRMEGRTGPGPLLELAFDSVAAATFRARVTFLMSGNMGIDPTRFESTIGSVGRDGLVRIALKMREQSDSLGQMAGILGQDTIRLRAFRWSGEDQMTGGARWMLIRQSR